MLIQLYYTIYSMFLHEVDAAQLQLKETRAADAKAEEKTFPILMHLPKFENSKELGNLDLSDLQNFSCSPLIGFIKKPDW